MSIGVGTLQPKTRIVRPKWIAGLLAIILALTVAVIVANSGDEPARETTGTQTAVSGTAANTPSELRGLGTTLGETTIANTPSELSGGLSSTSSTDQGVSPMERYEIAMERYESAIERYARHQLG
jgi:hypothetical protein